QRRVGGRQAIPGRAEGSAPRRLREPGQGFPSAGGGARHALQEPRRGGGRDRLPKTGQRRKPTGGRRSGSRAVSGQAGPGRAAGGGHSAGSPTRASRGSADRARGKDRGADPRDTAPRRIPAKRSRDPHDRARGFAAKNEQPGPGEAAPDRGAGPRWRREGGAAQEVGWEVPNPGRGGPQTPGGERPPRRSAEQGADGAARGGGRAAKEAPGRRRRPYPGALGKGKVAGI